MFYCNTCGEKKGWPTNTLLQSAGSCEICNKKVLCNDVSSKYLPLPKKQNIALALCLLRGRDHHDNKSS
jgi:hypothetical protein